MWKRSVSGGGDLSLWAGSLVNKSVSLLGQIFNSQLNIVVSQFVIALLNTAASQQTVDVEFADAFFDQVCAVEHV